MHKRLYRAAVCLLACVLVLTMAACGQPAMESGSLVNSAPVPAQSDTPPVPTVQVPDRTETPGVSYFSGAPDPAPSEEEPETSGDVPALPADEITELIYSVGDETVTAPALRHYTLHGYAITYDTGLYTCNAFNEGVNYWNSEGNYLSVSMVFGMPIEDVLAGLRLQEGIAMEPEVIAVGAEDYPAQTLHLTDAVGLYRQFWVLDCGGDVLLVEQSYDTVSDSAELYRASQLAMLDTLTLFY